MVSNWILSDGKSPQVCRTRLSILADLDNAVVRMVSTFLLISKSSAPFTKPFEDFFMCTNYNWYHRYLDVACFFFLVLYQSLDIYLSIHFLLISFRGLPRR